MAIIRSDVRKLESKVIRGRKIAENEAEIPFTPAYDLYEELRKKLSTEEVAAIGLALHRLLPKDNDNGSTWKISSRVDGLR